MVQPRAGQGAVQIALRLPPDIRDRLKRSAERSGRSLNSEILLRIQDSLEIDDMVGEGPDGGLRIRLSEELTEKVAAAAKRMNRSIEAQALDTLEKSYMPPKP